MNGYFKCVPSHCSPSVTYPSVSHKDCTVSSLKPFCGTAPFKPTDTKGAPMLVQPSLKFKADCSPSSQAYFNKKSSFRFTQLSSSESGSNVSNLNTDANIPPPSFSHKLSQGQSSSSRRKHYSPPPMTSSDASLLNNSSSRSSSSSRSPSPIQKPSSSCRMTPLTSPCLQLSNSACNTNFCSSYDKELENIRNQRQELCKIEDAKKKEVNRLNRQVEAVKFKELEIKRRELKMLKKRDKEKRKEDIRQLECLKREETRKLEFEFLYRQNCLKEEHDMEMDLLRRKEAEINAYQTKRYISPSPEPCEVKKIDRTLESIEAVFAEDNEQQQRHKNKSLSSLKDVHDKTLDNMSNLRVEGSCTNDSYMYRSNSIPSTSQNDFGSHRRWDSQNKSFSKTAKSSFPKGKIIIKHESLACNGGDCCSISGPTCSVTPTYGTKKPSKGMRELESCVRLCRLCQQDINRDTNNPCCLIERRRKENNDSYLKFKKPTRDKKKKKKPFFWRKKPKETDCAKKRNLRNFKTFYYRAKT